MNRRKAIKNLAIFSSLGFTYLSFYELRSLNSSIDISVLKSKKELIALLADVIIPRTDTPGARDAKVDDYIIKMIIFCSDVKTQNKFLSGLTDLEKYTTNKYGHAFNNCTEAEKILILKHFEDRSYYSIDLFNKIDYKFLGIPFFAKLKELTIGGYCISQLGATQGLCYDFIPVNYQACIPLKKNQRSWATK